MKKRIFALLLTVCMLLSLMPLGAFAEEDSEDIQILAEGENEDEGEGEGGKRSEQTRPACGRVRQGGVCARRFHRGSVYTNEWGAVTAARARDWGQCLNSTAVFWFRRGALNGVSFFLDGRAM